ncbi:MAG: response regulator [Deltaproteobacteria bacterium]
MAAKKIMIVDDNREFLEELAETLKMSGYEVVMVAEAAAVLDTAAKIKPDVILLDLKMPGKSGFEVADELKHFSELEQVPIIAMTGFLKDESTALMEMCGIRKCLRKPFNPSELIAEIEAVTGRNN